MARTSYLTRREGRYYVQARLSRPLAKFLGRELYRASLRTADYRQARKRLAECMNWVHRMNDSVDFVSLFQKNAYELRHYLADSWPISQERLVARRNYEELLKNMARRARADGCDPAMIEPDYFGLFQHFVRQNVDAEAWHRETENRQHYERGRADMQALLGHGAAPESFRQSPAGSAPSRATPPDMPPIEVGQAFPAAQRLSARNAPTAEMEPTWKREQTAPPARLAVAPQFLTTEPACIEVEASRRMRFSEALAVYLDEDIANKRNADARAIVTLMIQFLIDVLEDPCLDEFHGEAVRKFDAMMPDIPDRNNIPRAHCATLATRYFYAQEHGWDELKRLTENRIKNHYHDALARFFRWAIKAGHYPHAQPEFKTTSPENLLAIQRDAFNPEEVSKIFSQPLFTGCNGPGRIWVPGPYLMQSHIYWGYVISFLTGLRPGEIGQIELDDIQPDGPIYYLHLRAFDPSKGRIARKDAKRFKTPSAQRVIPLHPLILDLGLLDRIDELREIECPVLFPEWEPYPKPDGEMRWGQPLTKSFQYLKKKAGLERFDTALYSARHWFAHLLDNTDITHAARVRVMGHASRSDMPGRYGSKNRLTTRDLAMIVGARMKEIDDVSNLLLTAKERAERGELSLLKPWLTTANWSTYYRAKLEV